MTIQSKFLMQTIILFVAIASYVNVSARVVDLSKTDQTARFVPVVSDYTVEIYVDKVDGKATKFRSNDSAIVDAGERTMAIRLEYAPATGTSLILGGLGNLLARAATNKTFRTELTALVVAGHQYRLIARAQGEEIVIIVFDQTDRTEVAGQKFVLKDGKFERLM
ncbi:MAG: hypothetical protein GWP58_08230 [Gammaproteobacteria bacterium]|jgi:hypothetical protein|nr:hypothetical protein [Gammaproteobacteria bacterium]